MSTLRVLTWNVNAFNDGRADDKAHFLAGVEWDVALLQEVTPHGFDRIVNSIGLNTGATVHGCALVASTGKRPNGCAILVRNGVVVETSGTVPALAESRIDGPSDALPQGDRAIWAHVFGPIDAVVASFHAPNSGSRDPELRNWQVTRKLRAYEAMECWLGSLGMPVVVGMDANAWTDGGVSCFEDPATVPDGEQAAVHRFLGGSVPGLSDVYRRWLFRRPAALEAIRQHWPNGPLAVTYVRGGNHPIADRFDVLMASDDFVATLVEHHYIDSVVAGSDHGAVTATLEVAA